MEQLQDFPIPVVFNAEKHIFMAPRSKSVYLDEAPKTSSKDFSRLDEINPARFFPGSSAANQCAARVFTVLYTVGNIDPHVLVVSIGVGLAWKMAGMVYLYATNAMESPLSDTPTLFWM